MTLAQFKIFFENIAVQVVQHDKTLEISQFLMANDDNKVKPQNSMVISQWCMEVSYPVDEFKSEMSHFNHSQNFVVKIYKLVEANHIAGQIMAIDGALTLMKDVIEWIYNSQINLNGFGIIPNSNTKFDTDAALEIHPFIDEQAMVFGRTTVLNFKKQINLCNTFKSANAHLLYNGLIN